jgi:hypothetical protein
MNATSKASEGAQTPNKSRTRSPGYPYISLRSAIDRAKDVWTHEKRNPAPLTAMAGHWGINLKSSSLQLIASALKKYGLLEEVEGGKDRLLKLSSAALTVILHDQEDAPERIAVLKQCALAPKVHAKLWQQFNGELPSDATLTRHLIMEEAFNPSIVDAFIKEFRDTIAFAQLTVSDKIAASETTEDSSDTERPPLVTAAAEEARRFPKLAESLARFSSGSPPAAVVREFSFPLPTGVASLKVPFPLTQEDFDGLLRTLNNFKDGLVKKPEPPAIDCTSQNWEETAKALAEMGEEFNLIGFDYSHDVTTAKELAAKNGFDLRLDINKGAALFRKRESKN